MSTPLAKKVFELFGKPELAKAAEQQPETETLPTDYRAHYHRAVEAVQEECSAIDPVWLIDRHPELWSELRDLDERLSALERSEAEEAEYKALLGRLVACVQRARSLYEQERSVEAVQ